MLRALYTIVLTLCSPAIIARARWRARRYPQYRERSLERLGFVPMNRELSQSVIWIHAVSVGEVNAAVPLILALKRQYAGFAIVVTTTTPTGADAVTRQLGNGVTHLFFPLDAPRFLDRFIERIRPSALIVMETEIWPNLFARCQHQHIPVMLANARLSSRSFTKYQMLGRLMAETLAQVSAIAAQDEKDAERFIALGASREITQAIGSLKFDAAFPPSLKEKAQAFRRHLGATRLIFMAGSTRAGEEPLVLEAYRRMRREFPSLLLVLAPRHPDRVADIVSLISRDGLVAVRRSSEQTCTNDTNVYLLDTLGELTAFYAASDVVFVGGSLVPKGSHNVIEPAALGKPVLVGPNIDNFRDACTRLSAAGGLQIVANGDELYDAARRLLADADRRDAVGEFARQVVAQNRGSTDRLLAMIGKVLRPLSSVNEASSESF
ncbi:MAG: lipid IV(A) 3-deoxy-D-manno-octulosonic acid transferase [Pseudomonadota bacterium]